MTGRKQTKIKVIKLLLLPPLIVTWHDWVTKFLPACFVLLVLTNVIDPTDKVTAHGGMVYVHITNGQPKVYTTSKIVTFNTFIHQYQFKIILLYFTILYF